MPDQSNEMIARGVALSFSPVRTLRHIDDRFDAGFASCLGKEGRSFDQAIPERWLGKLDAVMGPAPSER